MARSAVPILSGPGAVRRPSRIAMMKAACPREFDQLPKLLLGVALALFVLGHGMASARVPEAVSLQWAAAVFFGGFLVFHAITWLLVKLKRVDPSRLQAFELKAASDVEVPRSDPVQEGRLDRSFQPAAGIGSGGVEGDALRAEVARRSGARVVFDGAWVRAER